MVLTAAVVACVLLGLLAFFQAALTAGAPWGRFAWGGGHERLPTRLRVGSALSILLYGVVAVVLLDRVGTFDVLGDGFSDIAAWIVVVYFLLGTIMNAASPSVRERSAMTPVAAALLVCSFLVAIS